MKIHSARVGRWLGDEAEYLSKITMGYKGPPIPILGTPWSVRDGDFFRNVFREIFNFTKIQLTSQIGGFTSLSDLISEASGSKMQTFNIQKVGVTGVVGVCNTLWFEGNLPVAGSVGAALTSNGTNCTRTTTGALGQTNAAGGDTLHIISGMLNASTGGNTLLCYDRLWHGAPAMNSSAAQGFTMTAPRYATAGAGAAGNVAWMEVGSPALAATAHSNTITYQDQDGNTAEAAAACAGVSGAIAKRFDHAANQWFFPLNTPDVGISKLTSYQCSAAVATGVMNLVLAHPLCFFPCPVTNYMAPQDGVNTMFNFQRVLDDACLSFIEFVKPATTATTYAGNLTLVSG